MSVSLPQSEQLPRRRLGAYEIVQRLATGGMAEVYVARRTGAYGFTKSVALKRILPQLAKDPEFVAMFIDEARICSHLSHPNLVEVFDFGDDDGELFMAMELVEGTTCAKLVRAAAIRGETVPTGITLHLVSSILHGLSYAHHATDDHGVPLHLIHRDVSPGNLLISRTGTVKLGDFGIVRAHAIERRTEQGQLKGKLGYMSPEQVMGQDLDPRSDLFTVGIMLAELLTGFPLFSPGPELDVLFRIRDADVSNFIKYGKNIPEPLRSVVLRALARSPNDRYATADAFAEALEAVPRQPHWNIGPTHLAAYLEFLGLVNSTGRSGEHRIESSPRPCSFPSQRVPTLNPANVGCFASPESTHTLYRLSQLDGSVSVPMSLGAVLEMFVAGKADPSTTVSRNDGPFLPAREHPEMNRIASSVALQWGRLSSSPTSHRWPIEVATFPLRLFDLISRRQTGVVHVSQGERRKKIYLLDGAIDYTVSTDREEMLGELLAKRGLVLPVELDMALAMAPRYGGRLGDTLIHIGILQPMDLFRVLVDQVRIRLTDLMTWRSGELLFEPDIRSEEEASLPASGPPFELLARAILETYQDYEYREILYPCLGAFITKGDIATHVSPAAVRLPFTETEVITAVTEPILISALIQQLTTQGSATELEVLRGIFLGLTMRCLAFESGTGGRAPGGFSSVPTVVK